MDGRVPPPAGGTDRSHGLSDEVALYHRTYTTLLRSTGETRLRVLEPSHVAMASSLHPLAGSDEVDLGAFLYAVRRLPDEIAEAGLVVLAQEMDQLRDAGFAVDGWPEVESPARRRLWRVGPLPEADERGASGAGGDPDPTGATTTGTSAAPPPTDAGTAAVPGPGAPSSTAPRHRAPVRTLAVLVASGSDVDDLVPTLVAFQIEWNTIRRRVRGCGEADLPLEPHRLAEVLGGTADDWERLRESWGDRFAPRLRGIASHSCDLRLRTLGTSHVGYGRVTRDWWRPVREALVAADLHERPVHFVSSNAHALLNLATGIARDHEGELIRGVERHGPDDLRRELAAIRAGTSGGSLENLLYFAARSHFAARPDERRALEHDAGVIDLEPVGALRVPVQVLPLDRIDPGRLDPRIGPVDAAALRASDAVIVNIDYPLGSAAYNILREVAVDVARLRGVYVLGKAATLNADVGDVLISGVVHDEHTRTTYWLDNAFSVEDLQRDLRYGTGLDNQKAVTVRSTFLQNRDHLDFYYREAFTVVEMEAGPFCAAVHELAGADRHPVGESVSLARLPVDFGVIHYASDTPYTQARTLGARGLSFFGMDATYAGSLAILRRILMKEARPPAIARP